MSDWVPEATIGSRIRALCAKRMTRRLLLLFTLGVVLLIAGMASVLLWQWQLAKRYSQPGWYEKTPRPEKLVLVRRLLSFPPIFVSHHDLFLLERDEGEAADVRYLISALRWQERTNAADTAMDCEKAHCLAALTCLTNQHVGRNFADWRAWWKRNANKTQRQWILDGFRIQGLPVCDPPDEAFARALVVWMVGKRDYATTSAWRLLDEVPKLTLQAWTDKCMASERVEERMGAVAVVCRASGEQAEAKLRLLSCDRNAQVAESALTALNACLRRRMGQTPVEGIAWKERLGEHVTGVTQAPGNSRAFVGTERLPSMGKSSALLLFDLRKRITLWTTSCPGVINCSPVAVSDQVFFCCADGSVLAANAVNGNVMWRQQTEGHPDSRPHNKVVAKDDLVCVAMTDYLWAFRRDDGHVLWKLKIAPVIGQIGIASGTIWCISRNWRLLAVSPVGEILREKTLEDRPFSFSVANGRVYVVSGYTAYLTALDEHDLTILWRQPIGRIWNWPRPSPVIGDGIIIACSNDTVAAFDLSGARLWTTHETHDSAAAVTCGSYALIINFGLELRDMATGEVKRLYREPHVFTQPVYVSDGVIATGDLDGNLWLLPAGNP